MRQLGLAIVIVIGTNALAIIGATALVGAAAPAGIDATAPAGIDATAPAVLAAAPPSEAPAATAAPGAEDAIPAGSPTPSPEPTPEDPFAPLTEAERSTLLKVAWQILSAHLREQPIRDSDLPAADFTPRLLRPRGCFVALKKHGQLRGMQGEIEASRALLRQVAVFTRKAATRDPRFEPLTDLDLPGITVEISVIGPRRTTAGPAELRLDVDGVFLEKWGRRALFLPGVGAAQGWTVERTLDELCKQATLPAGAWSQSAKLQSFTTELIAGGEPPAPPPAPDPASAPAANAAPSPAP